MKQYFIITRFRANYTDSEAIEAMDAMDANTRRINSTRESQYCDLHVYGPFITQEECDDFFRYKADTDDSSYGVYYYDAGTDSYYEYTPAYYQYITQPRFLGVSSRKEDFIKHQLQLYVTVKNGIIHTLVMEPESGLVYEFTDPFSADEHPEYNERIGNEIYSWISMWAESGCE